MHFDCHHRFICQHSVWYMHSNLTLVVDICGFVFSSVFDCWMSTFQKVTPSIFRSLTRVRPRWPRIHSEVHGLRHWHWNRPYREPLFWGIKSCENLKVAFLNLQYSFFNNNTTLITFEIWVGWGKWFLSAMQVLFYNYMYTLVESMMAKR